MVKRCRVCGRDDNRIQIRAGTGLCCNICEKIERGNLTLAQLDEAVDYLWSINTQEALKNYYALGGKVNATDE